MSPGLRSEGIIERTRGGDMETRNARLLFPGLRSFYDRLEPLSWLLVRCACGLILAVHGWGKIERGALAIAVGLFTRFFAAMVTIEMAVIMFAHYLPNGFSWLNRGYEFVLLWGLVAMAIWWRGGGPYSVDRKIGIEL